MGTSVNAALGERNHPDGRAACMRRGRGLLNDSPDRSLQHDLHRVGEILRRPPVRVAVPSLEAPRVAGLRRYARAGRDRGQVDLDEGAPLALVGCTNA